LRQFFLSFLKKKKKKKKKKSLRKGTKLEEYTLKQVRQSVTSKNSLRASSQ